MSTVNIQIGGHEFGLSMTSISKGTKASVKSVRVRKTTVVKKVATKKRPAAPKRRRPYIRPSPSTTDSTSDEDFQPGAGSDNSDTSTDTADNGQPPPTRRTRGRPRSAPTAVPESTNATRLLKRRPKVILAAPEKSPKAKTTSQPDTPSSSTTSLITVNGQQQVALAKAISASVSNPPPVTIPALKTKKVVSTQLVVDKTSKERRFTVENLDVPDMVKEDLPTAMTAPLVLEDAPFYQHISSGVYVPSVYSLKITSLGVNREVSMDFDIPHTLSTCPVDSVAIVRMSACPSISPAPEYHPMNLSLSLNGSNICQPEIYKHGAPPKKAHYSPVEIALRFFQPLKNRMVVGWTEEPPAIPRNFALYIQMAKRKSVDLVTAEMSTRHIIMAETLKTIYRQLIPVVDDEISTKSRTVSLQCPLSRKRLQMPVRGRNCTHLECFDGRDFIALNALPKAKWLCPKCSSKVGFGELAVDDFVVDLLSFTTSLSVELTAENNQIVARELHKVTTNKAHSVDEVTRIDEVIEIDGVEGLDLVEWFDPKEDVYYIS